MNRNKSLVVIVVVRDVSSNVSHLFTSNLLYSSVFVWKEGRNHGLVIHQYNCMIQFGKNSFMRDIRFVFSFIFVSVFKYFSNKFCHVSSFFATSFVMGKKVIGNVWVIICLGRKSLYCIFTTQMCI